MSYTIGLLPQYTMLFHVLPSAIPMPSCQAKSCYYIYTISRTYHLVLAGPFFPDAFLYHLPMPAGDLLCRTKGALHLVTTQYQNPRVGFNLLLELVREVEFVRTAT